MSVPPVVNITMPVFNRFDLTQRAIMSLRKSSCAVPFTLTVVDNGSEERLVTRLLDLKKNGVIDKLFLLPKNMGISCACNIGWGMTAAPYYMKLDNDMVLQRPDWLERLLGLWAFGNPVSNLGPARSELHLAQTGDIFITPYGSMGKCPVSLGGGATIIPKTVSDVLGFWSEDYSLYGGEDGDYGLRMNCAGFPQYYYLLSEYFKEMDPKLEQAKYQEHGLDRTKEYNALMRESSGGMGPYVLNYYLYRTKIRSLRPALKYAVADVDDRCRVNLVERKEYNVVHKALQYCRRQVDAETAKGSANGIFHPEFIENLKTVMRKCGQEYVPVEKPLSMLSG